MGAGGSFDEMGLGGESVRPLYRQIARWLEETPPEVLASFQHQNLATNANKGPNTNVFSQIESIQVTNGTLVIKAKGS